MFFQPNMGQSIRRAKTLTKNVRYFGAIANLSALLILRRDYNVLSAYGWLRLLFSAGPVTRAQGWLTNFFLK
jgi:hypothetical protein